VRGRLAELLTGFAARPPAILDTLDTDGAASCEPPNHWRQQRTEPHGRCPADRENHSGGP
jgi:hypothetical protein